MVFPYEEFDLSDVKTYPLKSRASKARVEDFGRPHAAGASLGSFVDALPNILAGADFKAVVRAIVDAKRRGGGIVWGLGAHVIKTGLGPVLIDLMDRGFVSAIAANGAAVIHDVEYLRQFGIERTEDCTAGALWRHLFSKLQIDGDEAAAFADAWCVLLDEGPLARRILKAWDVHRSHARLVEIYRMLGDCLAEGRLFSMRSSG